MNLNELFQQSICGRVLSEAMGSSSTMVCIAWKEQAFLAKNWLNRSEWFEPEELGCVQGVEIKQAVL